MLLYRDVIGVDVVVIISGVRSYRQLHPSLIVCLQYTLGEVTSQSLVTI